MNSGKVICERCHKPQDNKREEYFPPGWSGCVRCGHPYGRNAPSGTKGSYGRNYAASKQNLRDLR